MIACEFLLSFFLSIFSLSLSFIILHPYEIIDFITISKVLNLGGNTGKNYDGIKIKNGRTRIWAGKNFRAGVGRCGKFLEEVEEKHSREVWSSI